MATPDWTTVPDTSLEPGDPIRSIDIIAINNHTAAMAGGATGSPEIKLMAIETLSAGDVIRSRIDTEVSINTPSGIEVTTVTASVHSLGSMQIGNIRIYAEHKKGGNATSVTLIFRRIRNGVTTDIATWSTTSTTYVARQLDTDVLPGDAFLIIQSVTGVGLSYSYVRNARYQTNGENIWPTSPGRFENDYTVV